MLLPLCQLGGLLGIAHGRWRRELGQHSAAGVLSGRRVPGAATSPLSRKPGDATVTAVAGTVVLLVSARALGEALAVYSFLGGGQSLGGREVCSCWNAQVDLQLVLLEHPGIAVLNPELNGWAHSSSLEGHGSAFRRVEPQADLCSDGVHAVKCWL
ncbi:hypothetical protein ElyMa_000154000 [Elysia marginata]|uniref:Uncharacterized protein n=1 Tax=Elysia marginata TaxID=1093978 RepID=A0AAV4EQW6_9GAST|nr:hypothetical protein ElyMa_000154000 [Elysia marginata]